ncbi:MAG: hypothetical protein S4CHLAM20_15340 [Chlamydiia bacterium]|nr:hypothetical protein [Chlamydiia bacterium]
MSCFLSTVLLRFPRNSSFVFRYSLLFKLLSILSTSSFIFVLLGILVFFTLFLEAIIEEDEDPVESAFLCRCFSVCALFLDTPGILEVEEVAVRGTVEVGAPRD